MDPSLEQAVRQAALDHVRRVATAEGVVTWRKLKQFTYLGDRVELASAAKGIFKPRQLDLPISIRTTPPRDGREAPYEDAVSDDEFLLYRYRGTDPHHGDNAGLREVMREGLPLLYLHGIATGVYHASAAAIVDDDPGTLTFRAVLADLQTLPAGTELATLNDRDRAYQMRLVKARVHQQAFRVRVLGAYRETCAICRLRHRELLDAAHIIRDADGGRPIVPNGLSLCKIHHAAYDANIIGIRPDLVTEVRGDVRREVDGPMLAHGLQEFHDKKIWTPRSPSTAPESSALEQRYEEFMAAS